MPRQLIYTSVPRGLTPGQSGYCTVARSRDLREALIPRIEKLSYYTPEPNHVSVICAHRIVDLRGTKFHILSRIVDAGLDFTKRRSFLAHHLIFEPDELAAAASPAEIFVNWKGWLEHWSGDPQWLEDNRPLPAPAQRDATLAKPDVWITGDETDRKAFLPFLAQRGAGWEITFTNCFQPGDHPDDFDIKAAWPNTPGYEAAQKLDASFSRLSNLPAVAKAQPITPVEAAAAPSQLTAVAPAAAPPRRTDPLWPWVTAALTLIAFAAAVYVRHRSPPPTVQTPALPPPISISAPGISDDLSILLPDRPTWLVTIDDKSKRLPPIPPLEDLLRQLRANEIFTKDLTCTIQTNFETPPIAAALFAEPDRNLLRFSASNAPPIDLTIGAGATVQTQLRDSFAIEIPGRFRIIAIQTPVELPLRFLTITTNIELHPALAERIHRIEPPAGGQFALRPSMRSSNSWVDPLEELERDFAIVPSTILDLNAVDAHASQIIADKESRLRAYEEEQSALEAEQKKLLTDAQSPEQLKTKDRLAALKLAIPKARREVEVLRAKAAKIPKDPAMIDRFALFLCLSNVNTEIFRFTDKP